MRREGRLLRIARNGFCASRGTAFVRCEGRLLCVASDGLCASRGTAFVRREGWLSCVARDAFCSVLIVRGLSSRPTNEGVIDLHGFTMRGLFSRPTDEGVINWHNLGLGGPWCHVCVTGFSVDAG